MVRMRDGVRLATDVYLPAAPGRVPTVLVRLPYDKCGPFSFMPVVARHLTERGYAVVVQDVRGKVRSEGETFAFVAEARDAADTLEWIVSQPWSDGGVGMFGDSYYGFTQWAAVAAGHPALRAIVPRMTTTEVGTDWMYHQGVFCLATMGEWAMHTWVDRYLYEVDVPSIDWSVRPLAELVPAHHGGRRSASLDRWMRTPPTDPFWTLGIYGPSHPLQRPVPALHCAGWWDVFRRGAFRDHAAAVRAGTRPQYLVVDATDHFDDELRADGEPVEDFLGDPAALERFVPRYLGPALPFLDRFLMGREVRIPAVRWRLANAGWRESSSWPPPGLRELRLHAADAARATFGPEGGALAEAPDGLGTTVAWTHDPSDPVPDVIADPWRPLLGLPDERDVEIRDDVLTFTAEPVDAPVDLVGPAEAVLTVSSTGPSMHLVAKLVDVFPTGRARRITEGVCAVEDPDPERTVRVDLGPLGYRLRPGHRLRLEVAASCFPRYLMHPGTAEDPWFATRTRRNAVRLHVGGSFPAYVSLSVLPGGGAEEEAGPPW